jgi:hypothetical protein
MKLLLYVFEQLSWLKITFDKSEVLLIGGDSEIALIYAEIFNCSIRLFPMKYLGVFISVGRLHVSDWSRLEEKSSKKTRCVARRIYVHGREVHSNKL